MRGRDDKLVAVWVLGICAVLGAIRPNLHTLLGCRCDLYCLVDGQRDVASAQEFALEVATTTPTVRNDNQGGRPPLSSSSACVACHLASRLLSLPATASACSFDFAAPQPIATAEQPLLRQVFLHGRLPRGPPRAGGAARIA